MLYIISFCFEAYFYYEAYQSFFHFFVDNTFDCHCFSCDVCNLWKRKPCMSHWKLTLRHKRYKNEMKQTMPAVYKSWLMINKVMIDQWFIVVISSMD